MPVSKTVRMGFDSLVKCQIMKKYTTEVSYILTHPINTDLYITVNFNTEEHRKIWEPYFDKIDEWLITQKVNSASVKI